MDISELALRAEVAWLRGLAAAGFAQVRAGDGFAVATGLDSNSDNGAVGSPGELDVLLDWLRERSVPASVLVTGPPDPDVTARLIDRGLVPERTGTNMGRRLSRTEEPPSGQWQISEANDLDELRRNQRVYAEDGWWDEAGELDRRVQIAARLGRHWTAHHQGAAVGAATSFHFDDAVLLVQCCVAAGWRRRGIGTALTRVRLAAAAAQGAVQAVVFPTQDGYHLHRSLGFEVAPVHPDRCFYLTA
ncbi:GNAT family N-acetyltransferase [Paractinoplanes atraurantiacus]|uniref:Acetyltransferase (GNAT) family protein n=1 Tax=Paractinoplanes atraurantiacus TaxID=1036182 RepID=A0A285JVV0_9ACTN|nr:GNAT family N-acetyltransferase [Actinoplanes atraurantiacus]SNY64450.1 Acetyltransferase (GNAT) family protein [Actinoplanes atraurantiacus]